MTGVRDVVRSRPRQSRRLVVANAVLGLVAGAVFGPVVALVVGLLVGVRGPGRVLFTVAGVIGAVVVAGVMLATGPGRYRRAYRQVIQANSAKSERAAGVR